MYGWTSFTDHHIYIAETRKWDSYIVKHEMLHDLLGRVGHPYAPFIIPCQLYGLPDSISVDTL